jgi:microcystin-dependent protein
MGLEAATYINQLVVSNPAGTDDRSQGDDHIRLIKSTLKNTFPNVDGAVTVTDEQLNSIGQPGNLNFPGMIVMWSGAIANIPAGWKLCNGVGAISNGNPVPNLSNRFIIGSITNSGGTYNVGNTGGSANIVVTGSTNGHALTVNQLPAHNHDLWSLESSAVPLDGGMGLSKASSSQGAQLMGGTGNTGGGATHSHGLNVTLTNANIPPYFALAFIIKD